MKSLNLTDKMGDSFVAEFIPEQGAVSIEVECDGEVQDSLLDIAAVQELRDWLNSVIAEALK